MSNAPPLPELNAEGAVLVGVAEAAGAAIIIYDENDCVLWANSEQRQLAPVSDYARDETHSSLFWKLFASGQIGSRVSTSDPAAWLEKAKIARRMSQGLDWVSCYPSGKMSVTHRMLSDGTCVQARLNVPRCGVEDYFSPLGVPIDFLGLLGMRSLLQEFKFALDQLSVGIALVGRGGVIIHFNEAFKDIIDRNHVVAIDDAHKLVAFLEDEREVFGKAIEFAVSKKMNDGFMPLKDKDGKIHLFSVCSGRLDGTALILASPVCDERFVPMVLEKVLGIRPAEANVAALIGSGLSPAAIAERRATAEGTVYTQIKKIKERLRNSRLSVHDLAGLASLVNKIAGITRFRN